MSYLNTEWERRAAVGHVLQNVPALGAVTCPPVQNLIPVVVAMNVTEGPAYLIIVSPREGVSRHEAPAAHLSGQSCDCSPPASAVLTMPSDVQLVDD